MSTYHVLLMIVSWEHNLVDADMPFIFLMYAVIRSSHNKTIAIWIAKYLKSRVNFHLASVVVSLMHCVIQYLNRIQYLIHLLILIASKIYRIGNALDSENYTNLEREDFPFSSLVIFFHRLVFRFHFQLILSQIKFEFSIAWIFHLFLCAYIFYVIVWLDTNLVAEHLAKPTENSNSVYINIPVTFFFFLSKSET